MDLVILVIFFLKKFFLNSKGKSFVIIEDKENTNRCPPCQKKVVILHPILRKTYAGDE